MKKNNEQVQQNNEAEEIADAKGAVVAAAPTVPSTEVAVSGAVLEFPFLRLGQGMSQWRVGGRAPMQGAWYISKTKDNNSFVADSGRDGGVNAILLHKIEGLKEKRDYVPNAPAPLRWIAVGQNEDGSPKTIDDCRIEAANAGFRPFSVAARDAGMKIYDPFCYLCMLVQLPDDFESDDYRLYPIGGHLYTTARYEFDKQYYREFTTVLGNLRSRAHWQHHLKGDDSFVWSELGLLCHLYSTERVGSRSGVSYPAPAFEKRIVDGKPAEMTEEERKDFEAFILSVKDATAYVDESASEFDA